jgi:hypothetical protein
METGKKESSFVKWECKVHGITDFYTYTSGERYKCVICARKKSKEWSDKNKERVLYMVIRWNKNNSEKIEQYKEKNREECKRKAKEKLEGFNGKFGALIQDVSNKIELKKISRNIRYIKNPTKEKILDFLIQAKKAELKQHHTYRLSNYVKWDHLKSLNLKNATDEQKKIIREEYKKRAKIIVDLEMEKIIKNII